jgi:F-type H+-transporting ATPase subunit epsilon
MADKMQFDLVSPERMLASAEVRAVDLPASEGDMRAMPDHAPMVLTLRPGIIRAEGDKDTLEYVVTGGFVEINGTSVSVLAETAFDSKNADKDAIQALLDEAREQAKVAEPEKKDSGEKLAADLAHLLEAMV